jgi:hypothetical protein
MIKQIINKSREYISAGHFSLWLYGSSASDITVGRDIDAIAISSEFNNAVCVNFDVTLNNTKRATNLYLISEKVYHDDVYTLKYGGYYSDKFALTFRKIMHKGTALDAPMLFWSEQYKLYSHEVGLSPDKLMSAVHGRIMRNSPTFMRALVKFLSQENRVEMLRQYLLTSVLKPESLQSGSTSLFHKVSVSATGINEKAFFNFWDEYNRHKCKTDFWGLKTLSKIKFSMVTDEVSYKQLTNYLSITQ